MLIKSYFDRGWDAFSSGKSIEDSFTSTGSEVNSPN